MTATSSRAVRDGKGHRAYRRQQAALKRRTAIEGLVCGHGSPTNEGCGEPIDTTLPREDAMSFTADHPEAVNAGGRLVGQQLVPMHRRCNALKSDHSAAEIWPAS